MSLPIPADEPATHDGSVEGPFIRTVWGDLPASPDLGACDAHEHVVLRGAWLAREFPHFVHDEPERLAVDLADFRQAGGGWLVDAMPTGAGRDAELLARVSRQCSLHIVCATGVHQPRYYPPDQPLLKWDRDPLAECLIQEITLGVDDGAGRLSHRAGVIKVADSHPRLTAWEREVFAAAAIAHRRTGCPILTHTEAGGDASEQVDWLLQLGANAPHLILSHCDKNPDLAYHRDLLQRGVVLEYDQHFRQLERGDPATSIQLLATLVHEFPGQLVLGMDLARRSGWTGYGGQPGLAWLLTELVPRLTAAGVSTSQIQQLLVENPVRAFAFSPSI